jgi:hypothetical protein
MHLNLGSMTDVNEKKDRGRLAELKWEIQCANYLYTTRIIFIEPIEPIASMSGRLSFGASI